MGTHPARAAYWLFFLLLLFMPVTGFLTASYGGHPVRLFNLVLVPAVHAKDDFHARFFTSLHLLGQWAVYPMRPSAVRSNWGMGDGLKFTVNRL